MTCYIRVVEFANGAHCPIAGQYLKSFDFEAYRGRGYGTFTEKLDEAKAFDDKGLALQFWRTRSRTVPTRPDGKPNRPFTSTTIVIIDKDEIEREQAYDTRPH